MNKTSSIDSPAQVTRRDLMKAAGVAGAGTALGGLLGLGLGSTGVTVAQNGAVIANLVCEGGASFAKNFNPFSANTRWVSNRTIHEPLLLTTTRRVCLNRGSPPSSAGPKTT